MTEKRPLAPVPVPPDPADPEITGNENAAADAAVYADWAKLVERIQANQTDGMEELYKLFSKGIRFYLCRQLGPQELDDKVHDTFVVVVQAIRRGELREPQRLMGFVRTIVRRQVAAHIDRVVHTRREQLDLDSTVRVADPRGSPEDSAIFRQRNELIQKVLGGTLPERPRNPHPLLPARAEPGPNLFGNAPHRDPVPLAQVQGQSQVRRAGQEEISP